MRLSNATLHDLPADVLRPAYDRATVRTGVVHLGIGAFHRAHQAKVFDDAIAAGDPRWGVVGVSLRSAVVRDQLVPQDGLYSLIERDGSGDRIRVIGAVQAVLVAPENPGAVVAALAAPDTHMVTMTVTEKGYHLVDGRLDTSNADVAHDLVDFAAPRTAVGFVVAGLAARRTGGLAPFTTLSCDNLPQNGRLLRDAVLAMARARDAGLADWISAHAAFPCTMVDRIVPATTDHDIAAIRDRIGVEDRALVKAEPFLQWVIEDCFCGPHPDFEALGVQIAADVAPWEEAKLRLLNGAHSAIAYLGGLQGYSFVHEYIANADARAFVEGLWDESETTLCLPAGLDPGLYRKSLMARFSNPALRHRLRQIAMDGSQKIPQRLLEPAARRLARNQSIAHLSLAIAAWMRWQAGRDHAGRPFDVEDPLAAATAQAMASGSSPSQQVDALLAIDAVFPVGLSSDADFRRSLIAHLTSGPGSRTYPTP